MLTDFLVMLARRGSGFRWGLVGFGIGLHAIDASGWLARDFGWMDGCNVGGIVLPVTSVPLAVKFLVFHSCKWRMLVLLELG